MMKMNELITQERLQYRVLFGISLGALVLTGVLYIADKQVFWRFLGEVNPFTAFLVVVVLGEVLLNYLLSRGWFSIYKKVNRKGLYLSICLAAIFGIIAILVDSKFRFPYDLNVSFPASLFFYPAIGYLAEVLLHILPLTLLLFVLTSILKEADHEKVVLISIVIVSLLEPLYQTRFSAYPDWFPPWAQADIGIHIFLINLSQLLIFKRYDFVSMYAFRLVYYLFWHIGWGYVRLKVLF